MVTDTEPDAPPPTTAVIVVAFTTLNDDAGITPNLTAETLIKLEPVIVTVVPVPALVGVKDEITGGGVYVNPGNWPVPKEFVTLTFPEAPAPTTAVIVVAFTTVNDDAATPPNETAVVPVKLMPEIVTVLPVAAVVGVNVVM